MPDINGVTVTEMPGSGAMSWGRAGTGLTRIYLMPWADAQGVIEVLRGQIFRNALGGSVVVTPMPDFEHENLFVESVALTGLGAVVNDGAGNSSYEDAVVEVLFTPLQFLTEEETAARITYDFSGEWLETPRNVWKQSVTGDPVAGSEFIFVGSAQLDITVFRAPTFNVINVFAAMGKINVAEWHGIDAGHVLYLGPAAERTIEASGTESPWQVTNRFMIRSQHWNYVRVALGWREIEDTGGAGGKKYGTWTNDEMTAILRGDA